MALEEAGIESSFPVKHSGAFTIRQSIVFFAISFLIH